MKYNDLRDFIELLEKQGELKRITREVDPYLEMTEICDRTLRAGGPALLFENPKGSNIPVLGKQIVVAKCASCHGIDLGGVAETGGAALIGGRGSLDSGSPKKTVESYWPYASTVFDFVKRAMPLNAPGSLNDAEVYAVDRAPDKRATAIDIGATGAFGPGDELPPCDVVIDFIGSDDTLTAAAAAVAKQGLVAVVGLYGGRIPFGLTPTAPDAP